MGENTAIEWATHTFNPWIGCTKVSAACDNCYAERLAVNRLGVAWGSHAERRRTAESTWRQPLAWNRKAAREGKRARVFCASLADVFDNAVPKHWRDDLWQVIHETPHLDWLLLTKRPQNIARRLPDEGTGTKPWGKGWPNVWLGTTVENQAEADRRIPHLLRVPAKVRFLSCEPLLGPVDLFRWIGVHHHPDNNLSNPALYDLVRAARKQLGPTIDWVIAGGESGPGARPGHPEWFRSLRDQCAAAGVPFFFKQWGDWGPVGPIYADSDTEEHLNALLTDDEGHRECHITPAGGRWRARFDGQPPSGTYAMRQRGKRGAGRLLDGAQHDAVPDA